MDGFKLQRQNHFVCSRIIKRIETECGYVIDMDKRELVCYVGFNKKPVSEGLWANRKPDDGYYSVAPIKTYSFDELPSREKFIEELNTIRNN